MEVPPVENTALIDRARAAGSRIIFSLAPAAEMPEPVLRKVDVLLVNKTEADWLAVHLKCRADPLALHQRLDGVSVVITHGGNGAEVASKDGIWRQPAFSVAAVDTTAAGDCFAGVLAHALDRGQSLRDAVARASAAAAICCTRHGSQASLPIASETDAFIQRSI